MFYRDKQIVIDAKELLLLIRENPGETTEFYKKKKEFVSFNYSIDLLFKHHLIYKKIPLENGKRVTRFYEKSSED